MVGRAAPRPGLRVARDAVSSGAGAAGLLGGDGGGHCVQPAAGGRRRSGHSCPRGCDGVPGDFQQVCCTLGWRKEIRVGALEASSGLAVALLSGVWSFKLVGRLAEK